MTTKYDTFEEGNFGLNIGVYNNQIVLDFGDPVDWIGFDLKDAEQFVDGINQAIERLKHEQSKGC